MSDDDKKVKDKEEEIDDAVSSDDELIEEKESEESSPKNKKEEELKQKIEDLENEIVVLKDQFARAVADYRNLEKRFDEEKREFVKFANKDLLVRLIPAFDTLFLAEKYITDEGIKVTVKHLANALRDVGVERIETEGKNFDAEKMEAVTTEEGEDGKVLEELRPGFALNGKLVRPAQVKVGKKV